MNVKAATSIFFQKTLKSQSPKRFILVYIYLLSISTTFTINRQYKYSIYLTISAKPLNIPFLIISNHLS